MPDDPNKISVHETRLLAEVEKLGPLVMEIDKTKEGRKVGGFRFFLQTGCAVGPITARSLIRKKKLQPVDADLFGTMRAQQWVAAQ